MTGTVTAAGTPLRFGTTTAEDFRLLRRLREVTSHTERLSWTLEGIPLVPPEALVHLYPPVDGVDEDTRRYARSWSSQYRYGSFYYRVGPGFVTVKDVRPGRDAARMVIDDGSEHLLAMAEVSTVDELAAPARDVLDDAEAAGLILRDDEHIVVLPYRMRHWPVPHLAA
jgi:hypothetical protein